MNDIPLFKAMTQRMAWLSQRQKVLAQNVANADTPNYRPHDLKAPSFRELIGKTGGNLRLAATQPNHLGGTTGVSPFREEVDRTTEVSPSGNAIKIEDEMLKVSGTANDYAVTTNLYRQHLSMLKTVIGKGG
ncbi:MAG: flagellar basal body rod protein FlgB [Alphaproteobacteria bacterium]|nr:flagellar basal body rod protein FlgB [Alphaproteobacteria bacterium]